MSGVMMRDATAPIPYAPVAIDDHPPERLMQRLPGDLAELVRFQNEDAEFIPPHWLRMRLAVDPQVGRAFLNCLRELAPLVPPGDESAERAIKALLPDGRRTGVAAFAVEALENEPPGPAADRLFALAASGQGSRFDAAFQRADAPLHAHLLRLSAMREHGGMPWSDAFETRVGAAINSLAAESAAWTIRLIAELSDPRAAAFMSQLQLAHPGTRIAETVAAFLTSKPTAITPPPMLDDEPPLPRDLESLELLSLDTRKPARRVYALSAMAELDWSRTRRLASSITTDDWRLDETIGALLIYPSRASMREDLRARGLLPDSANEDPPQLISARELLRHHGRVVRLDTSSPDGLEGLLDHDALAYRLAAMAGDCFDGVDFLEELQGGESVALDAWADGKHFRAALDTRRSIIDPYGLVGLLNSIARERGRPERFMFAAEDRAVADLVVGPERELRGLVDAGLMWIKASFRWS